MVTKYPRSGRPAKKLFRTSFVEGRIYLTWKGKLGNQGVDMGEVSSIVVGLESDLLRKRGKSDKASQYLTLTSVGRSIDLFFNTAAECGNWYRLLSILALKERGELGPTMPQLRPDGTMSDVDSALTSDESVQESTLAQHLDWLVYAISTGPRIADAEIMQKIARSLKSMQTSRS